MNKRYLVFLIISILIFVSLVIPPFAGRITNEINHHGYVLALKVNNKMSQEHINIYRNAGLNTVIYDAANDSFDTELMDFYKNNGFNIALRVYGGNKKSKDFEAKLNKAIEKYNVKYLVIKQNDNENKYKAPLENIIKKHKPILVVSEHIKQIRNESPIGYEHYLKSADGKIMRAYETLKNPTNTLQGGANPDDFGNLLFHQMLNSIRDRNTEFMYVNPLEHESFNEDDSVRHTAYAIKSFYNWIEPLNYTEHKTPDLSLYKRAPKSCNAAGAYLGIIMLMICAELVFKKSNAKFEYLCFTLAVCAFAVTFFMPEAIIQLYPTAFALISACFAYTVTLWFTDYITKRKGYKLSLIYTVLFSVSALLFGSIVLSSLLSGSDYHLNNILFRGVKITLLLPICYSAIASWIYINGGRFTIDFEGIKTTLKKFKLWHMAALAVLFALFALYILRSGNSSISSLENNIRNLIAEITTARPRTKEFLIAFPLLALFVYYMKNSESVLLKWVFASGCSLLFASVTNTFCHVFADYSVSLLRTLYGVVFSIPFILLALFVNYAVTCLIKKIIK